MGLERNKEVLILKKKYEEERIMNAMRQIIFDVSISLEKLLQSVSQVAEEERSP